MKTCPNCNRDTMTYCPRCGSVEPPLIRGGQGRSAGQVREDSFWFLACLAAFALLLLVAGLSQCAGGGQ